MTTIKVIGNQMEIGGEDLASKLIAGCKGKITIRTPFSGEREVKLVDKISETVEKSVKVENAPVVEKPKAAKREKKSK